MKRLTTLTDDELIDYLLSMVANKTNMSQSEKELLLELTMRFNEFRPIACNLKKIIRRTISAQLLAGYIIKQTQGFVSTESLVAYAIEMTDELLKQLDA